LLLAMTRGLRYFHRGRSPWCYFDFAIIRIADYNMEKRGRVKMKWIGIIILLLGLILRWTTSISPVILWIIIIVGAVLVIIGRISKPRGL
jgi:hypothetical protein